MRKANSLDARDGDARVEPPEKLAERVAIDCTRRRPLLPPVHQHVRAELVVLGERVLVELFGSSTHRRQYILVDDSNVLHRVERPTELRETARPRVAALGGQLEEARAPGEPDARQVARLSPEGHRDSKVGRLRVDWCQLSVHVEERDQGPYKECPVQNCNGMTKRLDKHLA